MAGPVSTDNPVLAVSAATGQAAKSLCDAIKRYKERDQTLARLQGEVQDLIKIFEKLEKVVGAMDASMLKLLQGPVARCGEMCREFEEAMHEFFSKSKTNLLDWARMEFRRGDINAFIDTVTGYKSTINIALGIITINTAQLTQKALEDFHEMIENTIHNLKLRLQRIEDEMSHPGPGGANRPGADVNLKDEKEVTKVLLHICEDANSYLESLQSQEPVLRGMSRNAADVRYQNPFEAQRQTYETLTEIQERMAINMGRLRERLDSIDREDPRRALERELLQKDINADRERLEFCKQALNQVAFQKIHTFGDMVAEDNSDHVVVTTLADVFDVKSAHARKSSAMLVGSMTDEALVKIASDRYGSRFGTVSLQPDTATPRAPSETRPRRPLTPVQAKDGLQTGERPSSNTVKKRAPDGDNSTK